ncbi:MAG: ribose 5-phosphate isomerase B [Pseudomonadota bacterium]
MKIVIGSDHGGYRLKEALKEGLLSLGVDFVDVGCHGLDSVDYPDYGRSVGEAVVRGEFDRGVVVCGTGIGISIAANKVAGVRAALVHDATSARLAAEHNDANVLALGGRLLAPELALELVQIWLETPFDVRHQRRLDMITTIERGERA